MSYSQEESAKARELLTSVARLQPLVFGLAEELLAVSLEVNAVRLQKVLDALTRQVRTLHGQPQKNTTKHLKTLSFFLSLSD